MKDVTIDRDESYPVFTMDDTCAQIGRKCQMSEEDIAFVEAAEIIYMEAQRLLSAAWNKGSEPA